MICILVNYKIIIPNSTNSSGFNYCIKFFSLILIMYVCMYIHIFVGKHRFGINAKPEIALLRVFSRDDVTEGKPL